MFYFGYLLILWSGISEGAEVTNYLFNQTADQNYLDFVLYARRQTGIYIIHLFENATVISSDSEISKVDIHKFPLKIITHGWIQAAGAASVRSIKDNYLNSYDLNVITIDYSNFADTLNYGSVVKHAKNTGYVIANFINSLNELYNVSFAQMHLIGHSIGAHIMGVASSSARNIVGRITGLDPAEPGYHVSITPASLRLDATDADFVDVIHTNSGTFSQPQAVGTVDFYVNGGFAQTGCSLLANLIEACSHFRSFQYFAESIENPCHFPASKCRNLIDLKLGLCTNSSETFMGEFVSHEVKGIYYVKTNVRPPNGKGGSCSVLDT